MRWVRSILFWICLTGGLTTLAADEDLAPGHAPGRLALPARPSPWSAADRQAAAAAMTARVDALLEEAWQAAGVRPSPPSSDTEFLRRACLDLTGVIPTVQEIRTFLADSRPDRRAQQLEQLLRKPNHATHLANDWLRVMVPGNANLQVFGNGFTLRNWLRDKFADNAAYDRWVRELLLAEGNAGQNGAALYYSLLELKPEELASSTSRIFLGTQIACAQCHDHPFDHWTRQDFWGYAAFFARIQPPPNPQQVGFQVVERLTGELKFPGREEIVMPKYLGGSAAGAPPDVKRRALLADWMTASDNPFFARALVNRVWAQMFGRGLVNPVDDLGRHNPPSQPQLLEELSQFFVRSGYDLRQLYLVLGNTRAYQLSSVTGPESDPPPELFARMSIKSLTAEQLYDCLLEAMRKREPAGAIAGNMAFQFQAGDQRRQAFLAKFQAPTQTATEFEAGIPQALTLMNGSLISEATDLGNSDLLVSLHAPFFTDEQRIEVLFLSTLSRFPSPDEQTRFAEYVRTGGPRQDRRQALGDVLWALLNTAEFLLNH